MGLFTAKETTLLETVVAFLNEEKWKFSQLDDRPGVRFNVSAINGSYACSGIVDEEKRMFRFYVTCQANVPEPKRAQACEYVTRANYGLNIGNLEMDLRDGEVRYKGSVCLEGGHLTKPMVSRLVYCCIATMDRYYGGLMSILYAGSTPAEAVVAAEAA